MSRAAAIGDERRLGGYALAGAEVVHAATPEAFDAAWSALGDDVALVVLTPEAFAALGQRLVERGDLVWAVLPA